MHLHALKGTVKIVGAMDEEYREAKEKKAKGRCAGCAQKG